MIAPDKAPYPGLRPFGRDESRFFFGRDGCIAEMLARLAATRFLAVLGSSGTGKSSLVKTGFLSALEMGRLSGAGPRWRIVDFKPGGDPLRNLAAGLLRSEKSDAACGPPDSAAVDALSAGLARGGPRALIEWCREGNLVADTNLLLLVDQFEELFTYSDYDRRQRAEAFVSLLLESRSPIEVEHPTEADFPIYVTITMRSEYLGACSLIQGLAEAVNEGTYLTPRMKRREVEEAIVGPAGVSGFEVEPRLVNRLLNDMADFAPWDEGESKDQLSQLARRADQLPLMQHALNRMWWRARERHQDGEELTLTLADYRGLEQELDEHAEQVYENLEAPFKPAAECVFRAVTSGTTIADAVRRPTNYGDLVEICGPESRALVAKVIEAFGPHGCQFLTSDGPQTDEPLPDRAPIDIAHESLIRQWKRLSEWLVKEGGYASEWRRLREHAQRKDLLRGRALADAVLFRKQSKPTAAWADRYGGDFKNVTGLIKKSAWHRRLRYAIGAVLLAVVVAGAYSYQKKNEQAKFAADVADRNFALAVSSAQQVLDQVSKLFRRGDMTVSGANIMLQAADAIVKHAHSMDATHDTAKALIKLEHSFSDLYNELGSMALALRYARDAKAHVEPLRAANPDNPEILQSVYASAWRVGDAISYHGLDREHQRLAMAEYEEAQRAALRLAEMEPGNSARQRDLMFIAQKIGDVHQALGDPDKAIATYQSALDTIKKVAAAEPDNRGWRRDVANSRRRIGQVLAAKRDFDGALEEFNAAIEILADLEKQDFRDTISKSNLATVHRQMADIYARRGDLSSAAAEYASAFAIQQRLIAVDPDNATWRNSLATLYMGEGGLLRRQKELSGAIERYRKAYEIRDWLALKDPTNPARQNNLAKSAIAVADLLTAQNVNLDEAEKLYRRAIQVQELVLPRHDDDVFDSYIKIGDIYMSQDHRESALSEYIRAWSIANDTVAGDRTSVAWRTRLTNSCIKIGDLLVTIDRPAEAREHYQQALKIVADLATKNPQNTEWPALAESLKAKIEALRA